MLLYITILLPLVCLHMTSAIVPSNTISRRPSRSGPSFNPCSIGLNSHHCNAALLDRLMLMADYLRSGYSPGKRSMVLPDDVRSRAEELLYNRSEQTKAVKTLRNLLEPMGQQKKLLYNRSEQTKAVKTLRNLLEPMGQQKKG